jgi:hypothetical protein
MRICGAVNKFAVSNHQNLTECISVTSRNSKELLNVISLGSIYLRNLYIVRVEDTYRDEQISRLSTSST